LANLDFLRCAENVLFLGPSGIGKTHLFIALGYEAVKAGYNVLFLTTQELTSQLYASLADATFQRELERLGKYHTSNRPFQEWSGVFYDAVIVTAILDRILHHAHIFNMKGDS